MREILFRGRRTDGKWLYGHYTDDTAYDADFPCIVPLRCYPECADYCVDKRTVGQYTGLEDIDGNKIFEGDILLSRYDEKHPEDICYEVVLWHDNGWCIKEGTHAPGRCDEYACLMYSKVVGNVYDNPELLEEGVTKQ